MSERERQFGADPRQPARHATCDVCGGARSRDERIRLIWQSALAGDLVLAELCRRCAAQSDLILEMYGGRGRNAIRVAREVRTSTPPAAQRHPALGLIARGVLYLLVALAFFLIVTLISSRAQ